MKSGSTLFLKSVVVLTSLVILALCIFLLSHVLKQDIGGYQPIVIEMLLAAIPFFIGVYQVLKLLQYIDTNKVFTKNAVQALKIIQYCGAVICIIYAVGLPYIYTMAKKDDAPGVILLGLIFTFAPMIVSVFAAVFQHLLQNAIDLQAENELTV